MAPNIKFDISGLCLCFMVVSVQQIYGASPLFTFNGTGTRSEIFPTEHNSHFINASVPIIFEGKSYREFYITKNGLIAFTTDKSAVTYRNQDWSAPDVAPFIDLPFIAPYYHNGQSMDILHGYTGHVFYQTFHQGNAIQEKVLLNLGQYVRQQVVGSMAFNPTWGMYVTWENVTSASIIAEGSCSGTTLNPCPTNTFQLVLLTDGTQSYTIFNYGTMEMTPSKYTQAGFNRGSGTGFTNIVPESKSINQLSQIQGSDQVGRFIYSISSGKVLRGGCYSGRSFNQLSVYPNYAGMFGGKMIDISGPCVNRNQQIFCKFEDPKHVAIPSEVKAIYVSQTRVRCVVPRLLVRDHVIISLSTDNKRSYPYSTMLMIVYPGRMPRSEHVTAVYTKSDWGWYSHNPTTLSLKWTPSRLSNNSNDRADIQLIGYREENGVGYYKPLTKLGTDVPVRNGIYELDPQKYQCSGQDCDNYEVGLIEIRLKDQLIPQEYQFLSTKAVPLGWYVQNEMTSRYGSDWPSNMCVDWYNKASHDTAWLKSILPCPCSLPQAIADFGRWQPDHGCNLQNSDKPGNCFYHNEAVHCVRAVQPVNDAGNQCCYGKSGTLIFSGDTFQGSTPDRSHDWGAAPYGKPGTVPSLSHWIDDVVTYYYCCLWTGYSSCDKYMDLRPTRDCTGYVPPVPASVFGQGHISTFGGLKYRMLGPGDYVLLHVGNTEVQARFQRNLFPTENNRVINSTFSLTAVSVLNVGTSDRVELLLRQYNTVYQHIDVLVNGEFIEFNEKSMKWQDFKGVAVVNTDRNMMKSNFTVLLTNGIGLQVAEVFDTLQLDLMMPAHSFTNISGLLGDLNGNVTSPNGTSFDVTSDNRRELYNRLQLSWAVNDTNNLFSDMLPANHTLLGKVDLYPSPISGTGSGTPSFCTMVQGVSNECKFDYMYTASRNLARATRDAAVRYAALSNNLKPVRSCGLLNVPRSKKNNYGYTIGTATTITGCRSGSLSGTRTYTCIETSNVTQEWSPAVTATCEVKTDDANLGMVVGVVVAVVVVLLIAVTVAVIAVRKRRSQKWSADDVKTKDEAVAMKSSVADNSKKFGYGDETKSPHGGPQKRSSAIEYTI